MFIKTCLNFLLSLCIQNLYSSINNMLMAASLPWLSNHEKIRSTTPLFPIDSKPLEVSINDRRNSCGCFDENNRMGWWVFPYVFQTESQTSFIPPHIQTKKAAPANWHSFSLSFNSKERLFYLTIIKYILLVCHDAIVLFFRAYHNLVKLALTRTGRNQVTADYVFFHTFQFVNLSVDSGFV